MTVNSWRCVKNLKKLHFLAYKNLKKLHFIVTRLLDRLYSMNMLICVYKAMKCYLLNSEEYVEL